MKKLVNSIRDYIRYYTNPHTLMCLALLAAITTGLFYLNGYVLDLTHGCYNIFDVLFM